MQPHIYDNFITFANKLADASSSLLRELFQNGTDSINAEQKADQSPVTEADRAVEQLLRERIEQNFPNHGIVGEEFGNLHETAEYKWVIDPIDGTKSFIAGYPIFTTLIAILHNDIPILGIIDQPILRERWLGMLGKGTFFNGAELRNLKNEKPLAKANIATTSTPYFSAIEAEFFKNLSARCNSTILGGDAYAYAMLASSRIDAVIDCGMKPYDFCALAPIVAGVGGVISDFAGNPVTLHSNGKIIASANAGLHKEILENLNK
jgi:inositol-phosphate phosphatase/L-galactose 1-phosphate phosphatase/histidinol-phosphatase